MKFCSWPFLRQPGLWWEHLPQCSQTQSCLPFGFLSDLSNAACSLCTGSPVFLLVAFPSACCSASLSMCPLTVSCYRSVSAAVRSRVLAPKAPRTSCPQGCSPAAHWAAASACGAFCRNKSQGCVSLRKSLCGPAPKITLLPAFSCPFVKNLPNPGFPCPQVCFM